MSWTDAAGYAAALAALVWMLRGAPLPCWWVRWIVDEDGREGAPREW